MGCGGAAPYEEYADRRERGQEWAPALQGLFLLGGTVEGGDLDFVEAEAVEDGVSQRHRRRGSWRYGRIVRRVRRGVFCVADLKRTLKVVLFVFAMNTVWHERCGGS